MTEKDGMRKKEVIHDFDPSVVGDAKVAFIGRVNSHRSKEDYPANLTEARASDRASASVHLNVPYRTGFKGLELCMKIRLILWFGRARQDIIIQSPHHTDETKATFSVRNPGRRKPISTQAVSIIETNIETGNLGIDTS